MTAALHAVPDPEPDPEDRPSPGERQAPAPPVLSPGEPPAVENDAPAGDVEDEDDQAHREADQAPRPPRALTMPDLRPYLDPRPLAELGPLAVEASRASAPPLARALRWAGALLVREARRCIAAQISFLRGLWLLGQFLVRWLSGEVGKFGTVGARIAGTGLALYAVYHASLTHPAAPWLALTAVLVVGALVGVGAITLPAPEPEEKKTDGKKGNGKKAPARKSGGKRSGKKAPEESTDDAAESVPETTVEKAVSVSRISGLRSFLASRRKPPAEEVEQPPAEAPAEGAGDTPDQDGEEPPVQAPRRPSREALIWALNRPDREGKGVLLTALRKRLNLPSTQAVKEVLGEAGIRWRDGVRTTTSNGPGVHADDIPPLTPGQGDPQGSSVVAGQSANANNNNTANAAHEGFDVEGADPWIGPSSGDLYTPAPGTNRGAWTITPREKP